MTFESVNGPKVLTEEQVQRLVTDIDLSGKPYGWVINVRRGVRLVSSQQPPISLDRGPEPIDQYIKTPQGWVRNECS